MAILQPPWYLHVPYGDNYRGGQGEDQRPTFTQREVFYGDRLFKFGLVALPSLFVLPLVFWALDMAGVIEFTKEEISVLTFLYFILLLSTFSSICVLYCFIGSDERTSRPDLELERLNLNQATVLANTPVISRHHYVPAPAPGPDLAAQHKTNNFKQCDENLSHIYYV